MKAVLIGASKKDDCAAHRDERYLKNSDSAEDLGVVKSPVYGLRIISKTNFDPIKPTANKPNPSRVKRTAF